MERESHEHRTERVKPPSEAAWKATEKDAPTLGWTLGESASMMGRWIRSRPVRAWTRRRSLA